jgi:hypothetical protein
MPVHTSGTTTGHIRHPVRCEDCGMDVGAAGTAIDAAVWVLNRMVRQSVFRQLDLPEGPFKYYFERL